jgi:Ca2+-binding EF-hand superfamily protein
MRESFSVLDRSNAGAISSGDVATALAELGLDASPRSIAAYFPAAAGGGPGAPLNLGAYLALLSRDLARMSRREELMAAFAAFDDDDSGQIDVAELREALLTTAPETGQMLTEDEVDAVMEGFVGRRVLKKGQVHPGLGGKKEVFRYGDFTTSVWGGGVQPGASN